MNRQVTSNKQVTNVTCLFCTGNKSQTESLRLGGLLPLYVTKTHQKGEKRNGNKENNKTASSGGATKSKGRRLDDSRSIKTGGAGVSQGGSRQEMGRKPTVYFSKQ